MLPNEPEYIRNYVLAIGRQAGAQAGHIEILLYVASLAGHNGRVLMTPASKDAVARTVGCSAKSVDNALSRLVGCRLLHRHGVGDYALDPVLFMGGDWKVMRERGESFLVRTRFGPNGCEIVGVEREPAKRPADLALREDLEAKGQQRLAD